MSKKLTDRDKSLIQGIALACTIIQREHDYPVACADVLRACGLNRSKMKRAGVEDFDLNTLRPVFRELP